MYFEELLLSKLPSIIHSPHQDSRGPLAQDGSVEDRGSFHKSSSMYFMHI